MAGLLAAGGAFAWLDTVLFVFVVLIGFSIIIFFHELGHFLAAKWVGVRVHRFAVGFGKRLLGFRMGEGFTFGTRPEYSAEELTNRKYGETDYCLNLLPIGGYVKLLGQEDIMFDEKDNPVFSTDPRAFNNRTVSQRMFVVSMGVVFNILFAVLALIGVYMIGKKMSPPIVGFVAPDGPAHGKLMESDRILAIDGKTVRSFPDVMSKIMFADESRPLHFRVQRDGQALPDEIEIVPLVNDRAGISEIGIFQRTTTKAAADGVPVDGKPGLLKGDVVTHVDGREVHDSSDYSEAFRSSGGRILELRVLREDEAKPGVTRELTVYQRAQLVVREADLPIDRETETWDNSHLLGFQRRLVVRIVEKSRPAEKAGIKPNDLIIEWGGIPSPTHTEMKEVNARNEGQEIRVAVMREGKRVELTVTPRRPFKLFGAAEIVQTGIAIANSSDGDGPIVAAVAKGSPAEALQIPRGSKLLSLDGQPVASWIEVATALKAAAGREIEVRYESGGVEGAGRMHVPSSFINELALPEGLAVYSINGDKVVKVVARNGKTGEYSLRSAAAIRRYLKEKIGQTVTLRFSRTATGEIEEKTFVVREDNCDPWQMRLDCVIDTPFELYFETVSANGNPLTALVMGATEIKQLVQLVYVTLTKVATKSSAAEQVAGPIGIVSIGIQTVKNGPADFLWFLAILSVNLAVINFLPMPVMDGGLMVFLLIEKIKGKPLSFNVQMWTTLVGLAAIILIGVLVTVQDITRFF
jgi:regulator of sigma E protease